MSSTFAGFLQRNIVFWRDEGPAKAAVISIASRLSSVRTSAAVHECGRARLSDSVGETLHSLHIYLLFLGS